MSGKVRVAVIGCGRVSGIHFNSILKLKNAELVCCCDNNVETLKKTMDEYKIKGYLDYKEMFEKENLDAVHLCLPHYLHVPVSIYAMEHGVNVLCEKPMAITYDDAVRALEVSKKTNKLYSIIFQCRYNASSIFVKNKITSGEVGKIKSARSVLTWEKDKDYYLSSNWKGTWDKEGGGVLINQSIHSLDLVNWFVDSPVQSIQCSLHKRKDFPIEVEDTAEGLIKYESGVNYLFYASNDYAISEPIEIRLACEKARIIMSYTDAVIYYNDGRVEKVDSKTVIDPRFEPYWGSTHIVQINDFYEAILSHKQLDIKPEDILGITKIMDTIYKIGKNKLD